MFTFSRTSALAFLALSVGSFTDGSATAQNRIEADQVIELSSWNYEPLYDAGISISKMIDDMQVFGTEGEEIGNVENVLFSPEGRVLSVIAEVGGFWDIGDTHVNIPWVEVEFRPDGDGINVPVTEVSVDAYSLYPDEMIGEITASAVVEAVDEDLQAGPRVWRATELMGDYARLREGDSYLNYGYVDDIMILGGEISAIMVRPSAGMRTPGAYGYPYYGRPYGWTPGAPAYDLPYGREEIGNVEPFDYEIVETQ